MPTALDGLPDDLDGLRAAVVAMRADLAAERTERQRLEEQNERLCHFIRQLQRMQCWTCGEFPGFRALLLPWC